ncbi:MAG: hypothetical protein ABH803_01065 [Candidatus Micrarchaeota archaeon]
MPLVSRKERKFTKLHDELVNKTNSLLANKRRLTQEELNHLRNEHNSLKNKLSNFKEGTNTHFRMKYKNDYLGSILNKMEANLKTTPKEYPKAKPFESKIKETKTGKPTAWQSFIHAFEPKIKVRSALEHEGKKYDYFTYLRKPTKFVEAKNEETITRKKNKSLWQALDEKRQKYENKRNSEKQMIQIRKTRLYQERPWWQRFTRLPQREKMFK